MASLEDKLVSWTGPSSPTEQEKQDRTERMVTEAVRDHPGLNDCTFTVYTKGSYPNNTNVKADSDVDVAVQCSDVFYWDEAEPGAKTLNDHPLHRHMDAVQAASRGATSTGKEISRPG